MKNSLRSLLGFLGLKKKSHQLEGGSELPEGICRQFSLAEIEAATNNFHPDSIIGQGGFGTVYKGTINDGTIVAVKRQARSSLASASEFKNEVQLLCQLRHPHLVSFVGFCVERDERIIVYEYMSRGSLFDHLRGKVYAPLPWKQRLIICTGAARGLHYLQTGAKRAVIHRDIKTSNLLLDDEFSCKLCDFGLCKLGPRSMSKALKRINTQRIVGTFGYMAPEYALNGELTEKSDVFSFGIVLLEILCGRGFYDLICEFRNEGTIYNLIDPYLKGKIAPECLKKYLEIACSCAEYEGNERPAMGEVEVTLELALELQEKADSEMEAINPSGGYMYEEDALFSANFSNLFGLLINKHDSGYTFSEPNSDSNNSNNNS